jgi:hypothetical protein
MGPKTLPTIWHIYMKLMTKYQIPVINSCWEKCDEKCAYMFNVFKNQLSRQTGSRNLTGQKTLPTIWHTYMKLMTKYQIPVINSCLEKCDEKWTYMFNVYKNQQSRQTGRRNLTGPKMLPTIWYTYMTFVTKYQISAINSYWENCDEKYVGRMEGQEVEIWRVQKRYPQYGIPIWRLWPNIRFLPSTFTEKTATKNILDGRKDRRTEVKQYTPSPFGERGYNYSS